MKTILCIGLNIHGISDAIFRAAAKTSKNMNIVDNCTEFTIETIYYLENFKNVYTGYFQDYKNEDGYDEVYPPLPNPKGSFQQSSLSPTVFSIIDDLFVLLPILIGVAFVTVAERKTLGSMQRRLGPNIVGAYGSLQAFADALKLILKEYVSPTQANLILFFLGPVK